MEEKIPLEDIPGIGPKTAQKLKEVGITDTMTIAVCSPGELASVAEIGEGQAKKIITAVKNMLKLDEYEPADKILQKEKDEKKITTGSKALDKMLGGGVATQRMTEVYGRFGTGKSQIAFQLAVNVQLPPEKGGLGRNCLFIDTENTFSAVRIAQIAKARGFDPDKILPNIYRARAYDVESQILFIENIHKEIKEKNIGLIIIDSLMSHFRAQFIGRAELATRQQKLNRFVHMLQRVADAYDLVVYVTNQVMDRPDILFGDPVDDTGGNIVKHMFDPRIYLRRGREDTRLARLVDSSYLPPAEAAFKITADGIRDS